MIKIKSFTEIFTTEEDKKAFIKLLDTMFPSKKLNSDVIQVAKEFLQKRNTNKTYAKFVSNTYEAVSINTAATESGDDVDALSQSTGIDKLTLYDLYFRRLSAKHAVDNPGLLTDGIQRMLECKTADELNALGIKTFGDEWPVSGTTSAMLTTLRGENTSVYQVSAKSGRLEMSLFSSPMPYPELYKDVPKDCLTRYASDLAVALIMLFSIKEDGWRGRDTTPLWDIKDNKFLKDIILAGEDSTKWSDEDIQEKLKPFEHLLFLCLIELRRSETCGDALCGVLNAVKLGEYMLDHGFGEEYIDAVLHCNCWGVANYDYLADLCEVQGLRANVRGIGMWTCMPHIDDTFTKNYNLQDTSVVKNILTPVIKGKPIQPCFVSDTSFKVNPDLRAETESCALLDISLQDVLKKKAILATLMGGDLDEITVSRVVCCGALPIFYAGGAMSDYGYDIIGSDAGYRCYRGLKSVGSIISNPAFNPHDINQDRFLVPGRDVIDGLPVLLHLQAFCEGFSYMDSSTALLEDRIVHPHGLELEQTELGRSVLEGASRLILTIYPCQIYDLGIYLSAGLKPVPIFIERTVFDAKYFICVETEEQKKIIEDIIKEAMENSGRRQTKLNCFIHVCGRTTDAVWMAGSNFFEKDVVMSSDVTDAPGTLTYELLSQSTLLSVLTLRYLDSLLTLSDETTFHEVVNVISYSYTPLAIKMVLCAATETDDQMKEYASDNIDLEECFVCATGEAVPDLDAADAFKGHIMRRRGHCYISSACVHLNLDGTLDVEVPTKGIYFVSVCNSTWGAFYVSDGYMEMLTIAELQSLIPNIASLCKCIIGMNTQEKMRLCVSLLDMSLEG